jgi:hypothetical protein
VWQALRAELHPRGLEVVTVALDVDSEHARPFIEQASPEHPSLIDSAHVVDELFGIANVPNSVWIDEQGTIVRPAEPANVRPSFAERVRRGEAELPAAYDQELLPVLEKLRSEPEIYLGALRDWVEKGPASAWAKTPDEVLERSRPRSLDHALAAAHFELGRALLARGETEAAQGHWREAHRLDFENWTYKRQAWSLVSPDQGPSAVYDGDWLSDVKRLGPENYFPAIVP